jgi:hypothetical protein
METITNLLRPDDGFGENYKYLIYTLMYAEFNKCEFVYNPFKVMRHNYNDDPEYINKKEKMINCVENFKPFLFENAHSGAFSSEKSNGSMRIFDAQRCKTETPGVTPRTLNIFDLLQFYHQNVEWCSQSNSLKMLKSLFYLDKVNLYDTSVMNIAIHIRRINPHDYIVVDQNSKDRVPMRDNLFQEILNNPITAIQLPGMDVPRDLYINVIQQLEQSYPNAKFHIYSQGCVNDFKVFEKDNTMLHLNECLETTFQQLVFADILVTSPSSLSYVAGLLSNNIIYYVQCLNPPLPHWNIIQNYKSSKMKHKFSSIDNNTLAITDFTYDPCSNTFEKLL